MCIRKIADYCILQGCRYSKYNPATATFTAATVGGVTTGGWDYKEAHYSAQAGKLTDRYLLQYKPDIYYKDKIYFPTEVQLTRADAQVARSCGLEKYLHENTLILRNKVKSKNAKWAADTYAQTGDFYAASNLLVKDYTATLLTQDEMHRILDFLCGDDNIRDPGEQERQQIEVSYKYRCTACNSRFSTLHKECPCCHAIGRMQQIKKKN